ncbi:UDP-N-acetylglucosamine--N-acetylmuramyl-(pentapeptide) pyrophosphoryl-undecaprenol N-acetylglucosamine transferase [Kushneria pakistanensis]|uniref:UDP-N-acetylglucosamine--N-acetylmuramyl-(pentapeptide) pyrophosphoryl-undecaprenol N-acetylglucosamine transferase n=1 Tax=Kushneria pakistanensis TaxID=1508770 RepID=A0ABQ3FPN3_9GAMM|nr:undecaprenyldiphospho-muramoylpentapeptide beta-N-acetylglucosaminyltransferase [Kushneria pakistanensis]GHC32441.1 UDP-N-acetylglucosamine--N-acetylmuramyl-(pentapeptide) pyrophosphoryl-undecaprenol N-acetylglucosamine transferase [Kushneria pakistanensis]
MSTGSRKALIMAGGTGGHVVPALSLARALQARGIEVHWLGTPRGIENTLVPEAGIPLHHVSIVGLRGNGTLGWLKAPWRLWKAVVQARRIIGSLDVSLVVGLGGFASGPGGLAAWLMKRPLVIHEQNALPGMTNKALARLARRVYAAFPDAFPASRHPVVIGNPVRQEIAAIGEIPQKIETLMGRPLRLLVVGGSLGAQVLNERVPEALARLAPEVRPEVRHQAGKNKDAATIAAYQAAGVEATVSDFIGDMAQAYEWADLVVCRSGALTVTELAAAGRASLLVPFPHAVDDHQTINANYLLKAGAAQLVPQAQMSVQTLSDTLAELLDAHRLVEMGQRARSVAQLEATDIMARGCMETGFE